jgi:hypothetical protein
MQYFTKSGGSSNHGKVRALIRVAKRVRERLAKERQKAPPARSR